ncbi:hypothetical protein EH30_03175 [Erythrobacter sp. JL475]|nr:hypothetical protein EH30_03175 [Erythrobacter sp. JL475]
MSKASIALNRFGYGLKRAQSIPDDPARYLLGQMDAYDPSPAILAGRADNTAKPGEILQMLRRLRQQRQMQASESEADMAAMTERARGSDPLNGLPPEVRQSYMAAGQTLRRDVAIRTNMTVASDTPMMERLVHFWSNHFSVSAQKPGTHYLVADHEFQAIRPFVLGRFSDMLKAAVLHPAMLLYLDQFQSVGPNSRFMQMRARRRQGDQGGGPRGLNENLAREILELHTLGVDGGYSQGDVTEFARALTGWSIEGLGRFERFTQGQANGAAFVEVAHEPGNRTIMGRSYRDGGARQALEILDDLATHPSTARFVATKLARHFGGDDPPASLINRLEADFLETGGDLASLTRALIEAPEVWPAEPVKFRQPFEWLVSVLRLTGVENLDARRIPGALNEIGQLPWRAPSPAGYDDLAGSWAGPDALFRRVELAERIARNAPADDVMERAQTAFPGALSDNTRIWLSRAESGTQALGLLLVSPEMMRR